MPAETQRSAGSRPTIRVLVAEDSPAQQEYLVQILEEEPSLTVIGRARDGAEAVELTRQLAPHVVVMDVNMPRVNGFEATRRIMESTPTPIVMATASVERGEVELTFQAMSAGALAMVEKPPGRRHPGHAEAARRLVETVKAMAEVKVIRRRTPMRPTNSPLAPGGPVVGGDRPLTPPLSPVGGEGAMSAPTRGGLVAGAPLGSPDHPVRLVAIGASTGGPQAISAILSQLPASLGVPILVVQHIAPGFTQGMAQWLDRSTPVAVKVAEAGEVARPGSCYLAPNGFQLGITRQGRIHLSIEATSTFRPSASFLFESVAATYGPEAMGILLTGMGKDGATGLARLRAAGGLTVAQDEASCVIFGMPAEAIELGAASYVLSPDQIARLICSVATRRSS